MNIEDINITKIKLNPNNPRLLKDDKFKQLVKSIQDFPQMLKIRPIVVNDDMIVLGGNMRLKACKEAGLKKVPVIKASELTEEQQREFIIKDNVGFGEWDWEMIANEWDAEQVTEWGLDIPDFAVQNLEAEEDDYEIPDEIKTDIVLGDLFEIGNHRLLCGDSTNSDDVAKLLNSKEPYLMVTDPPYGVNYDPNWRAEHNLTQGFKAKTKQTGLVSNDDKADWTEAWALSPSKVTYVWHGGRHAATVQRSLEDCNFVIRCQIVWNKGFGVFGRGDYHWQHEPCWYAVKKGSVGNWAGDRKQTTVWDIKGFNPNGSDLAKREEKTGHGTQKPVECMARPIGNHDGDVYDPFLGSGTTMVAAHQLKGKWSFDMAIDGTKILIEADGSYWHSKPHAKERDERKNEWCQKNGFELYRIDELTFYKSKETACQVIVDRMLKLDPSLEIKRNGKPYKTGE